MKFKQKWQLAGIMDDYSKEEAKEEPMLFRAEEEYAREKGGPIINEFLNRINTEGRDVQLDTRMHMLMPGYYPCIPGWHLDNAPRTEDGTPQYWDLPDSEFYLTVMDFGTESLTQFIDMDEVYLTEPNRHANVYDHFDREIETRYPKAAKAVKENRIIKFTCHDFHRGVPAQNRGWRLFMRANIDSSREARNEKRQQVQAYFPADEAAW